MTPAPPITDTPPQINPNTTGQTSLPVPQGAPGEIPGGIASQGPPPPDPNSFDGVIQAAKARKAQTDAQIQALMHQLSTTDPNKQIQDYAAQQQKILNQQRVDRDNGLNQKYGTAGRFLIDMLRAPGQLPLQQVAQNAATTDFNNSIAQAKEAITADRANKQEQLKALQIQAQQDAPLAKIAEQQSAAEAARKQHVQQLKDLGVWDKLSPREQAVIDGGQTIAPERTGMLLSSSMTAADIKNKYGVDLPSDTAYRVTSGERGPEFNATTGAVNRHYEVVDGKIQQVSNNSLGTQIGQTNASGGVVVPTLTPKTTDITTNKPQLATINGQVTEVPITTNTQRTVTPQVPGQKPNQVPSTSTAPIVNVSPKGQILNPGADKTSVAPVSSIRPGTPLGDSQSTFNMRVANQLQPWAAQIVAKSTPVISMMDQAEALIKAENAKTNGKDFDTPGKMGFDTLAYLLGYTTDDKRAELVNLLNLGGYAEAGRLMQNMGSRGQQILSKVAVHTANSFPDSYHNMLIKIQDIRSNLQEAVKAAQDNGKKYPGLSPQVGGASSTPAATHTYDPKTGKIVPVTQ